MSGLGVQKYPECVIHSGRYLSLGMKSVQWYIRFHLTPFFSFMTFCKWACSLGRLSLKKICWSVSWVSVLGSKKASTLAPFMVETSLSADKTPSTFSGSLIFLTSCFSFSCSSIFRLILPPPNCDRWACCWWCSRVLFLAKHFPQSAKEHLKGFTFSTPQCTWWRWKAIS